MPESRSRTALVTGAAGGIGFAIARALGGLGDRVFVNDVSGEAAAEAVETLRSEGTEADAAVADVSDRAAVDAMVEGCVAKAGQIDVLVNCAAVLGTAAYGDILEEPPGQWERFIDVNLSGAYYCSRAVLRHMVPKESGTIVNISSTAGLRANEKEVAYVASKSGMLGLTRALALDYAEHGIRVNAIAPGWIDTEATFEWVANVSRELKYTKTIPLGHGRPEDIAAAAIYLADDAKARFITGTTLSVDGGSSLY